MAFGFDDLLGEMLAAQRALVDLLVDKGVVDPEEFEARKAAWIAHQDQEDATVEDAVDAGFVDGSRITVEHFVEAAFDRMSADEQKRLLSMLRRRMEGSE